MGRKRRHNKHLPDYLYYRPERKNRPYRLYKPDGTSQSYANLNTALEQWGYYWGGRESCLISDIIDTFLIEVVPKLRERTQRDYRGQSTRLRRIFGEVDIRDLQPHHLIKYRDKRGHTSVHQANREIAVMSGICKVAIAQGLIARNPCKEVPSLTEYARDVDVTWPMVEAVFNHAERAMQIGMMLVAITGMRPGEPREMLRSAFSDDGLRYVESKSQRTAKRKGGHKRHWEWSPMLHWCYDSAIEMQGTRQSVYLLPAHSGGPYTASSWSKLFRIARERAIRTGDLDPEHEFQLKDIRAMASNEADNPFELLQHSDGTITMRHYANRRARTTRPLR